MYKKIGHGGSNHLPPPRDGYGYGLDTRMVRNTNEFAVETNYSAGEGQRGRGARMKKLRNINKSWRIKRTNANGTNKKLKKRRASNETL